TIFEAAERCGWKLYAYVIMSDHYHLAIETPDPNMVEGMRWLQSTFATRFNRFHNVGSAGSFRKFSYFPDSSPICYRLR
ncbi:MAG: transposase, partial [Opitutales bacterium]